MNNDYPDRDRIAQRLRARGLYRGSTIELLARYALNPYPMAGRRADPEVQRELETMIGRLLPGWLENRARAAVRDVNSRRDERDIVQVKFPSKPHSGMSDTWTYRCPGAEVGDLVIVPPTPYCSVEQFVPVVAKGRSGWYGPVKAARLAGAAQSDDRTCDTPTGQESMCGYGGCPEPEVHGTDAMGTYYGDCDDRHPY